MEVKSFDSSEYTNDISKLFFEIFTSKPWFDKWKSISQVKDYLLDIINTPNFRGFILIDKNHIVGFALGNIKKWYSGNEFYISEMCIKSDKQRKGLGSILIKNIEKIILK